MRFKNLTPKRNAVQPTAGKPEELTPGDCSAGAPETPAGASLGSAVKALVQTRFSSVAVSESDRNTACK